MSELIEKVLVTGWPLLPPAEKLLTDIGLAIIGTSSDPDAAEIIDIISAKQPEAVIVRSGVMNKACFAVAENLRAVAYHGAGYDVIDVSEATRRGVAVFAAPGRNAISVAEHAMALLLAIRKQLFTHDALIRQGGWRPSKPATGELFGQTIGLIGLGAIGEQLARLAQAFGMHVIAYDPGRLKPWPDNIKRCEMFEALLINSDVVSLHVPLTPQTQGMIDATALSSMKPGAILINAARGGIVDEAALVNAINTGHIFGAGFDTFDQEPPGGDAAICESDRIILTPHIAGVTPESTLRMSMCCAENILHFLRSGEVDTDDLVNPGWRN